MEVSNVVFSQEALDDLEEIVLYIAQDNRNAALRLHDEVMEKTNNLKTFPKLGRPVPDTKMKNFGFRMLLIKSYIAFYRILDDKVYIYRVVHGATNYPMLYAKLYAEPPKE